jgi:hypothetical protein
LNLPRTSSLLMALLSVDPCDSVADDRGDANWPHTIE